MQQAKTKTKEVMIEAYALFGAARQTRFLRSYNVVGVTKNPKRLRVEKDTWSGHPYTTAPEELEIDIDSHELIKVMILRKREGGYGNSVLSEFRVDSERPESVARGWKIVREEVKRMSGGDTGSSEEQQLLSKNRYDVESMNIRIRLEGISERTKGTYYLGVLLKYVTVFPNDGNKIMLMFQNNDPNAGEEGHDVVCPEIVLGQNFAITGITHKGSMSYSGTDERSQQHLRNKLLEMIGVKEPKANWATRSGGAILNNDDYWEEQDYLAAMQMFGGHMLESPGIHYRTKKPKKLMFVEGFPNEAEKEA